VDGISSGADGGRRFLLFLMLVACWRRERRHSRNMARLVSVASTCERHLPFLQHVSSSTQESKHARLVLSAACLSCAGVARRSRAARFAASTAAVSGAERQAANMTLVGAALFRIVFHGGRLPGRIGGSARYSLREGRNSGAGDGTRKARKWLYAMATVRYIGRRGVACYRYGRLDSNLMEHLRRPWR